MAEIFEKRDPEATVAAARAVLQSMRGTLLDLRSGQAQVRAAGLSSRVQRLATLAQSQGAEAALADEVTSQGELAKLRA